MQEDRPAQQSLHPTAPAALGEQLRFCICVAWSIVRSGGKVGAAGEAQPVTQDEVEEAFFNRPQCRFVESGHRSGEDVYSASGQADADCHLIVFFIAVLLVGALLLVVLLREPHAVE